MHIDKRRPTYVKYALFAQGFVTDNHIERRLFYHTEDSLVSLPNLLQVPGAARPLLGCVRATIERLICFPWQFNLVKIGKSLEKLAVHPFISCTSIQAREDGFPIVLQTARMKSDWCIWWLVIL